MAVAVQWPDGRVQAAASYTQLLARIAHESWNEGLELDELKEMFAKRAWVWSGGDVAVDPFAPPARFFKELERAKMLRIVRGKV